MPESNERNERLREWVKLIVALCGVAVAFQSGSGIARIQTKASLAEVQAERDAAIARALEKCMGAALDHEPVPTSKAPLGFPKAVPTPTPPPSEIGNIAAMRMEPSDFLDMVAVSEGWKQRRP